MKESGTTAAPSKEVLRRARSDKRLSQRALAELLGKSHGWVGQVERGDIRPTTDAALKWLRYCGHEVSRSVTPAAGDDHTWTESVAGLPSGYHDLFGYANQARSDLPRRAADPLEVAELLASKDLAVRVWRLIPQVPEEWLDGLRAWASMAESALETGGVEE